MTEAMTPEPVPALLTPQDVADMLRMKADFVVRNASAIGGFKVGKYWRFTLEAVQRYIATRQRRAA